MNPHLHGWWFWLVRAVGTGMFAAIAIVLPPLTGSLAIHLYGAYVKLDGFLLIGINANTEEKRPWLLFAGVLAVASGVAILIWPTSSPSLLLFTLAGLTIARGAFEMLSAFASKALERLLRVMSATWVILLGLMLVIHEPLELSELVAGFAIYASLSALCQIGIGLEQRAQETSPRPPLPRRPTNAPAHGLRV